jgi:hypothetical protein
MVKLKPGKVMQEIEARGLHRLSPIQYFEQDDWAIDFRPIPVKVEMRGKHKRVIGMLSEGGARSRLVSEISGPLREKIEEKANRSGKFDIPYIIAVNALADFPPRIEDTLNSVYGGVRSVEDFREIVSNKQFKRKIERSQNGFWRKERDQGLNTRVSGVLFAIHLDPWNLSSTPAYLCHNPWATHSIKTGLLGLPEISFDNSEETWAEGSTLREIFGLPSGWPRGE